MKLFFLAIRDPDGSIYLREYNGGVLVGTFETVAKPAFEDDQLPGDNNMPFLVKNW